MKQLQADYRDHRASRRISHENPGAAGNIVDQVEEFGFAIVDMGACESPEAALKHLSDTVGLGGPYVSESGRTVTGASPYKSVSDYTGPEGWHVDGLLEDMGTVKTTVLYCVRRAAQGGATVVFNAPAAFEELRARDPAAAETLLDPGVLTRRVLIPGGGYGEGVTGPVFARYSDGCFVTRYSDNHTCEWNSVGAPGALERALAFFRSASEGSRYRSAVRLAPGEVLLFRNDRLSHDRESFQDDPDSPRLLVRALHTEAPKHIDQKLMGFSSRT
ncbi:TauD/TfdA family dioxygenase [Streptomyces sp. NPDC098077]|uniref:TauD/TfdA family dioxygenase n=1 Tax=Streptomyces sp. NPDC098077 TaxID=3366093 RepID=UPI00381D6ECF